MTDNEKDRIVDSANQNDDAIVGNSRPKELSDFIGQKRSLVVAILDFFRPFCL